jgi:hypothetical protein
MPSAYRKGRPEYIPVVLTLQTRAELDSLLRILSEAQKETMFRNSPYAREAKMFEDLLIRFVD